MPSHPGPRAWLPLSDPGSWPGLFPRPRGSRSSLSPQISNPWPKPRNPFWSGMLTPRAQWRLGLGDLGARCQPSPALGPFLWCHTLVNYGETKGNKQEALECSPPFQRAQSWVALAAVIFDTCASHPRPPASARPALAHGSQRGGLVWPCWVTSVLGHQGLASRSHPPPGLLVAGQQFLTMGLSETPGSWPFLQVAKGKNSLAERVLLGHLRPPLQIWG